MPADASDEAEKSPENPNVAPFPSRTDIVHEMETCARAGEFGKHANVDAFVGYP